MLLTLGNISNIFNSKKMQNCFTVICLKVQRFHYYAAFLNKNQKSLLKVQHFSILFIKRQFKEKVNMKIKKKIENNFFFNYKKCDIF